LAGGIESSAIIQKTLKGMSPTAITISVWRVATASMMYTILMVKAVSVFL
jgi:hypothetical protein